MSRPVDRAARRQNRKEARPRNDAPLLALVPRVPVKPKRERVKPLTPRQHALDVALASKILTFAIGPAGTGKTYLPAARAAEALAAGDIERIIVTRPTVEAGSTSIGFLPGTEEEKVAPYFRPVLDALEEVLGAGAVEYHLKAKTIEFRPLQFIRGATLKNAFVLLDEAQNTTPKEMELFLTRIGENVTVLVDGDLRQSDIAGPTGLFDAMRRFENHDDVAVVRFDEDDIVRSGFCRDVVLAYSRPLPTAYPSGAGYNESMNDNAAGLRRMLKVTNDDGDDLRD